MMHNKLRLHLKDALKLSGDVIDLRINDGGNFIDLINFIKHTNKKCYGVDTFKGLPEPDKHDLRHPNLNEVKKGQYAVLPHPVFAYLNKMNVDDTKYSIAQTNNYTDLEDIIPSDAKFCFAVVDLKQHNITKIALEYLWSRMTYAGTIFISNYDEGQNHSQHYAVKDFLSRHDLDINVSRQMMVDGRKESFVAIKCLDISKRPLNFKFDRPEKVTIAMVLKTGGEIYNHNYVNALAKGIKKNITVDHEIVCITDNPVGFSSDIDKVIPFSNDYPTWWGKIELFKHSQFSNHVFYMDLDTVIVGNIDEIVSYRGEFSGLRDFYALHSLGSGVMAWNPASTNMIYQRFVPRSREIITSYREGDQRWIDENKPSIDYLQDMFPNQIVSFKRHCMNKQGQVEIPKNARIICFHGNPRPHAVNDPIIKKYWQPN